MLNNYLKIAFRHLLKNKVFRLINILGLTVGLSACLVIFQYVSFELSYDQFHTNKDQIYRVFLENYTNTEFEGNTASTVAGLGPAIQETVPEMLSFARVSPAQETLVTYHPQQGDAVQFIESKILYADPAFLQIFSFPLLQGNVNNALQNPQTLLIAASTARKYFKDENPAGKLINIGESGPYLVQGVFADVPENSHLQFDFLLSFASLGEGKNEDWSWSDSYTYLLMPSSFSIAAIEAKMKSIVKLHHREGSKDAYHLQPLSDIHLNDTLRSGIAVTGSAKTVYFMITIGVVLLLIALINFINLTTIKNLERIKEIGIRKVMGASRLQLTLQIFSEIALLNIFALLQALCFIILMIRLAAGFGWSWFPDIHWQQPEIWLIAGSLLAINTILTTLSPFFSISFYPTLLAIKSTIRPALKGMPFSKVLIVFQFAASLVLLSGIFIIYLQLRFMKNQNLDIDIAQTLVIQAPYLTDQTTEGKFQVFKSELEKYPAIHNVTHSTSVPGQPIDWQRDDIKLEKLESEHLYPSYIIAVGYDFMQAYRLKLLAGRNFQEDITTDAAAMLINEEAARQFNFSTLEDALDQHVFMGNREFHIIGVVKNYHHLSLKENIDPILYFIGSTRRPVYSIKLSTQDLPQTIAMMKTTWEKMYAGNVFSYFFLDEFFGRQYQTDQQFGTISGLFTLLALLITCLGLFALASYITVQRTKEIGIRKVLGASLISLLTLLSRQYIQLILMALLIAIPVANYFITEWLKAFAYKIDIRWWMLALPGILIVIIALLSVIGQTWKTAHTNPVDSLRYE